MQIHISTSDGIPIYLQIITQVKYLVASHQLTPGDEMPAIRKLAELLLVNPNTVARAFRALALEGVLESKRGTGNVISGSAAEKAKDGLDDIKQGFGESVRLARRGGLDWKDIDSEVKKAKGDEK